MPLGLFGAYGFEIAVLLVSMMIAVGGIVLGIGHALNDKKLKEMGKGELMQSLINGAMVGGFMVLFAGGGMVGAFVNSVVLTNGTSLTCNGFMAGNTAICFAYDYLVGSGQYEYLGASHASVLGSVTATVTGLIALYAALGAFKTFLSPLLSQVQSTVQVLGAAAVSVTVQASVLAMIAVGAVTLLLPLGLILRTFYPSRKLGGFVIALTIGLYLVLPLSYVMNATLLSYYTSAQTGNGGMQLVFDFNNIEGSLLAYTNTSAGNSSIVSALSGIGSAISSQLSNLVNYLFNIISYFILATFILPAFSLTLTGISVRELAAAMGSDTFFGKMSII